MNMRNFRLYLLSTESIDSSKLFYRQIREYRIHYFVDMNYHNIFLLILQAADWSTVKLGIINGCYDVHYILFSSIKVLVIPIKPLNKKLIAYWFCWLFSFSCFDVIRFSLIKLYRKKNITLYICKQVYAHTKEIAFSFLFALCC